MKKNNIIDITSEPCISRRYFIGAGISLAISGSLLSSKPALAQLQSEQKAEEKLLSILNGSLSAVQIGLAIQSSSNMEFTESGLVISIMESLKLSFKTLSSISNEELSARFKHQTVNDFDSEQMISVSGWHLGMTEARLCMLSAKKWSSG